MEKLLIEAITSMRIIEVDMLAEVVNDGGDFGVEIFLRRSIWSLSEAFDISKKDLNDERVKEVIEYFVAGILDYSEAVALLKAKKN